MTIPAGFIAIGLQRWVDEAPPTLGLPDVPGAGRRVQTVRRLAGGASQETWAFDVATDGGALLPLVLRRAPPGAVVRGGLAAGLAAEAALMVRAARAGVPVPAVHGSLRAADGLGEGFVMQRLAGETLGRRIVADARFTSLRQHLAFDCGVALARIHGLDVGHDAAPALARLRRAGPAAELAHYRRWHAGHGTLRPVFQLALQWLTAHAPAEPSQLTLVHGDFRTGNLLVDDTALRGVLDWELAHIGDPMEDLGWLCVNAWRFGAGPALPVGGFGALEQLFEGYRAGGGALARERVRWWQVMGTLKWGLVCEGMLQAWLDGSEPVVEKAAIGRRACETEIDLLDLLVPRKGLRDEPAAAAARH